MTDRPSFFAELKRRNVLRAAALYIGAAWALSQGVAQLLPVFDFPNWVIRWFVIAALIGFPFAMLISWFYEWTPHGIQRESDVVPEASITRETGKKLDRWIIAMLSLAVVLLLTNQFVYRGAPVTQGDPALVKSIAVLPFLDLSPGHDQGNFSDGMAEEILNALARVKEMKVIGRSSSFHYKGKDISDQQIGRELGVAHLLEGSVRRQGDQLRINVALVRTADGGQEWAKAYDGKLSDVFDLQESCARDIAAELKVELVGGSANRLVAKSSDSPQAYVLFVEAQTLVNRRVGDSLPRAIVLLKQATAIDPKFARAWSKQAIAYAVLTQYTGGNWTANWKQSDAAAQRAIALDPNDAEAYAALSYNEFSQRHYVAMVAPMRHALTNDPDNTTANYWAANELSAMGRKTDAEARLDAVLHGDPGNALVLFYKGALRLEVNDSAGTLEMVRRIGNSQSPFAQILLAFQSVSVGDYDHGAQQYAKAEIGLGIKLSSAELEAVYRGMYQGEVQRLSALKIVEAHFDDDSAPTFLMQLGEPARSFDAFEHGHSGLSDAYLNWLWWPEAWSRKARQDPSFQGFAKRMGMVNYWKQNGWPDLCKPTPEGDPDAFTCR